MPTVGNRYLIHSPSADPDKPLIAIAWFHPEDGSWSLVPEYWTEAITHWAVVPGPPEVGKANPKRDDASDDRHLEIF